jgi:hypothetical protein
MVQASKEQYWEEGALTQLVLDLRQAIEVVALASAEVKPAIANWKSFLSSLIFFKKDK